MFLNKEYTRNDWRMDDEEEEKEETPKSDLMMFSKKLEKYFLKVAAFICGVL